MKINGIDNLGYVISVEKAKRNQKVTPEHRPERDKLELSEEAKQLNKSRTGLTPERLELIRQRIAENFYDQDEIINEIANRMLKSPEFSGFRKNSDSDRQA